MLPALSESNAARLLARPPLVGERQRTAAVLLAGRRASTRNQVSISTNVNHLGTSIIMIRNHTGADGRQAFQTWVEVAKPGSMTARVTSLDLYC